MESTHFLMPANAGINCTCRLNQRRLLLQTHYLKLEDEVRAHWGMQTRTPQIYEHTSWRTLNRATVTTTAEHTYSLGQRECDLQTLPLSRRRKMGQNNRNRLRCFYTSSAALPHHTACFQLSQTTHRDTRKVTRVNPRK